MPDFRKILNRNRRNADPKQDREDRRNRRTQEGRDNVNESGARNRIRRIQEHLTTAINADESRRTIARGLERLEDTIRGDGSSRTRAFFSNFVNGLRQRLQGNNATSRAFDDALRRNTRDDIELPDHDRLRQALEQVEDISRQNLEQIGSDLEDGRITADEFRDRMQREIRQAHTLASIIGQGGVGNITQNTMEIQDRMTSRQLRYLDRFHNQIEERIRNNEELTGVSRRAGRYNRSIRPVSIETQRQSFIDEAGDDSELQERRRLDRAAENCPSCERYHRMGWRPVGTLPPIGVDSECGNNCRCKFEYRISGG